MVIGTLQIELILHDCHSLKEKRGILKRIIDRTKNRFNTSVAEVDSLNSHQRGQIGLAVVSNDRRHVNSILDQIIDFIEDLHLAEVAQVHMDLL